MSRRFLIALICCLAVLPAALRAQATLATDPVMDAVRIGEVLDIVSSESIAQGLDMDQTMLQGAGGAAWERIVTVLHDPDQWERRMRAKVGETMDPRFVAPILGFLGSDQGRRIVELELSARRAMLDETVEAASQDKVTELQAAHAPLLEQISRFIAVNDLIDANVVGAMNANAAFVEGLQDGSGAPAAGDYLSDIWSQEPEIRDTTSEWLYAFLTLAYSPLSSDDMEAYIAFSESDAGQAFNVALFAAFDEMFVETSRATGMALGRLMSAEDI